ncbi:hypothetical protein T439DRAFT_346894 [Meredithblackwellia eburnea MCA 4105]
MSAQSTERDPLLPPVIPAATPATSSTPQPASVPSSVRRRLYVSHLLSTWNTRVFEFGAVLYLAKIFPGSLLPMSLYALTRGLSAILFAPAVGSYIDVGNRLKVVRTSILAQRLVVAASCALFYILALGKPVGGQAGYNGILALLAFLACIEKLSAIMNLVAVERDWVVVVADKDQSSLREINAQMRRIDLVCKLLGPLFIALLDGISTELAILVNFGMNLLSVGVEYLTIAKVYYSISSLQEPKTAAPVTLAHSTDQTRPRDWSFGHNFAHAKAGVFAYFRDVKIYVTHPAFLPSLAVSLLYLTVLSFSGQQVTFLLASGYTSAEIGVARTFSVAFEVLATWIGPWLISKLGPVRAGLWSSVAQFLPLAVSTFAFFNYQIQPRLAADALVLGVIVSRIGLRSFDLCVQLIVQEEVGADQRGAFSAVEAAAQNTFELLSYLCTIVFFRPTDFKWPALISVLAVGFASFLFTIFVRIRRGHLVHFEKIAAWTCLDSREPSMIG